ncbi:APC membrane recruitment protein 3 [Anguilla anguilla]|uniref:APC membrane recruitment protein 3 n=1 Tax=Anguilla anguilla TaxID=7936 RepID=UPI0015B0D487|nr:APC membrane recruitment protein 3 [Anguilla anguilla]XP_035279122.1 APC membrane recruitment protein 3 [Anguilla anguilla]
MEELPNTPKGSRPLAPGDNIGPCMEGGNGETECFSEGCPSLGGMETSIHIEGSCTKSPASPVAPSLDCQDILSPAFTDTLSAAWAHTGSVRKSKTHDCVAGMGWYAVELDDGSTDSGGHTPTVRQKGRLVSSVSFSGFAVSPSGRAKLLRENQGVSAGCSREIIDYRNLTPQVPFVPSFAKSIPKKRISLRRPRRAIKDLLGKKRAKQEKAISPRTPTPGMAGMDHLVVHNGVRKHSRSRNHPSAGHSNPHKHNDPLSDSSSSDYCHNICEDVTSLKSFGSQTGCGEIFAEEENLLPLEATQGQGPDRDICEPRKSSPVIGSFQGGVEQMASPAHSEILDLFGMWDSLGRPVLLRQSPIKEGKAVNALSSTTTPTKPTAEHLATSPHTSIRTMEQRMDTVTQKSDTQETISTSDEGYYEYISPGQEVTSREVLSPCRSARFPRDSYSGDALYELFYDPGETGMTPIFDDEMGLSESVLGLAGDLPMSMYSFHVGAEENLAPPLAPPFDLVGQDLLHSSWRGKDCLLKLCDTEISLAMGIVNWFKQRAERMSLAEPESNGVDTGKGATSANMNSRTVSPKVQEGAKSQLSVRDYDNTGPMNPKETVPCQPDAAPVQTNVTPTPMDEGPISVSPGSSSHVRSRISTPTNGFCFRIFNKDSPLTPDGDLESPALRSPGSGTSAVFLLAINKDSLCSSCKSSLKQGSKELYLCVSCLSLIEHISTSDLSHYTGCDRSGSPGTPRSLPRGFLDSPISPCMSGSDIDILQILEQCVGQVSSLKISGSPSKGDHDKGASFSQLSSKKDVKAEGKGQRHRYLKSKHKRKISGGGNSGVMEKGDHGTCGFDNDSLPHLGADCLASPPLEEAGSLSSVSEHNQNSTQTPRPRSLPLSNSTYSEFGSSQSHVIATLGEATATTRGQPREKARRHKKSAVNRDGPCGYVMLEEKKVERRCRMKK